MRLVAVLGYSSAADAGSMHVVCAARLAAAERVADPDAVLFSGAARHGGPLSEAELMRAAWHGADVPLHIDTSARTTAGNAAGVASLARQLGATEVVIVTSSWHAPRARALVRAALRRVGRAGAVGAGGRPCGRAHGGARAGVCGSAAGDDGAGAARRAGAGRRVGPAPVCLCATAQTLKRMLSTSPSTTT